VLRVNSSRAAEPEVVIKEVYVDVIKEVQVLVEVPVVREVHIEVPVEVIREVIVEVPVLAPPTAISAGGDSNAVTAKSETVSSETVSAVTAEDRSSAEALQQATFTGACTLGANMLSKRDYSSAALAYKLGESSKLLITCVLVLAVTVFVIAADCCESMCMQQHHTMAHVPL
jgi:hypothetical protein